MATGDLRNNLRKLQSAIKGVDYQKELDLDGLSRGTVEAFLPVYHHAFVDFSRPFAAQIVELGVDLVGKTDSRFIEGMYKVLRELFTYKPPVTQNQFFSPSYAERKVIMCTEILVKIKERHRLLAPKSARPRSSKDESSTMQTSRKNSSSRVLSASLKKPPPEENPNQKAKPTPPAPVHETPTPEDAPPVVVIKAAWEPPQVSVIEETGVASAPPPLQPIVSPIAEETSSRGHNGDPKKTVTFGSVDEQLYDDSEQGKVEIVYAEGEASGHPFRNPALTPIRPLTSSPLHLSSTHPVCQRFMGEIAQKIESIEQSLRGMLQRLESVEQQLGLLQGQNAPPVDGTPAQMIESLLARMTLVENQFQLMLTSPEPKRQIPDCPTIEQNLRSP